VYYKTGKLLFKSSKEGASQRVAGASNAAAAACARRRRRNKERTLSKQPGAPFTQIKTIKEALETAQAGVRP
jgi:chaperonin cofactor prefoldin